MIHINETLISPYLKIKRVRGLYDFPALKQSPVNWLGRQLLDYSYNQKSFQYKSRVITIDFVISMSTYAQCLSIYSDVQTAIDEDDLLMMELPEYSNRGYLVYSTKGANIKTNYANDNCVFEFTLEFTEPQPFNIQFYYEADTEPQSLILLIGKVTPSYSTISENQKYINVWFQGSQVETNVEQGIYSFAGSLPAGFRKHLCIITGDIDTLDYIGSNIATSYTDIANYYFRNGTITV